MTRATDVTPGPDAAGPRGSLVARWRDEVGETYMLGLARAGFGVLLCLDALTGWRERARHGHFADSFFLTSVPAALVPSASAHAALLGVELLAGVLVAAGWWARPALAVAAATGVFGLLANRLEFHNNRYALFCYCAILALAPCDRSVSWRARRLRAPGAPGPLWAQRMAQLQVSLIYLASGGSKLLDPDWRSGVVLADRWERVSHHAGLAPELRAWLTFASRPAVAGAASALAITTELFLVLGLWLPRTRVLALWLGLGLHVGIEIAAEVQLFTWLTLTAYLLFVTPATRTRRLHFDPTPDGTPPPAVRLVAALDWFARWTLVPRSPASAPAVAASASAAPSRTDAADVAPADLAPTDAPADVAPVDTGLVTEERDGTRRRGWGAAAALARTLPALFPAWPLVAAVAWLRARATAAPARPRASGAG